jgi:hypothetical protein
VEGNCSELRSISKLLNGLNDRLTCCPRRARYQPPFPFRRRPQGRPSPASAASFIPAAIGLAAAASAALRSCRAFERGDLYGFGDWVMIKGRPDVIAERDDEFGGVDRPSCRHITGRLPGKPHMLLSTERKDSFHCIANPTWAVVALPGFPLNPSSPLRSRRADGSGLLSTAR